MSLLPDFVPTTARPRADSCYAAHLLSNGSYATLLSEAGGGYSAVNGFAITRWVPDPTRDVDGFVLYVRDLESGVFWSAGGGPAGCVDGVNVAGGCVRLDGTTDGIEWSVDVCVALHDDAELRRLTLRNAGARTRRLDVTTYAELALNTPAADAAHPAFSKLFVQTAHIPARDALLAWRRPRSPHDRPLWVAHRLMGEGDAVPAGFETDRARFLGRGRGTDSPAALLDGGVLEGTVGSVLDAVFCARRSVTLAPGGSTTLIALLAAADSRDVALRTLGLFPHVAGCARAFETAAVAVRDSIAALGLPRRWRETVHIIGRDDSAIPSPMIRRAVLRSLEDTTPPMRLADAEPLQFFNGWGGFTQAGDEYVIRLRADAGGLRRPPLPWVNVIANEDAGCIVSESGATTTWAENSRENRITPWFNDPVTDPHGEALYIRDEADGAVWSPTPGPAPGNGDYEVRHGFGYTRFRHHSRELDHDTTIFVPADAPVRIARIRITNRGSAIRRLRLFGYAQLVLGSHEADTRGRVATWQSSSSRALLARNPARGEYSGRIALALMAGAGRNVEWTTDRRAFLGPLGSAAAPHAVAGRARLDGASGDGLDPCFALSSLLELPPDGSITCAFVLGEAANELEAERLAGRFADVAAVDAALAAASAAWRSRLGAVRIETPVPALDLMVNGWLAYQNLSCRMWARSAYYQSGGAFGFRDQLQDSSALLYLDPALTHAQILLHAAHQFEEGDVLHWWHPPLSKGIRTRFSDDLLWLPYITAFYIACTGDGAILDEPVRYLRAPALDAGEDEEFLVPETAPLSGSLYEHCCRTLDRSLTKGAHGLPLIGAGDWNDGMNRVGRLGRGESVWLAFFLYDILRDFMPLCEARGDVERAACYRAHREHLAHAVNDAGWDGGWYRRAFYDHGAPLGSASSDECRIDALAQAWAVMSGAAPPERAALALDALEEQLVSEEEGLIRLLTPPFDRTPYDPGYIKGYIPGVRENGGQYTHGVLWAVRALAQAGRTERAARLLEMLSPVTRGGTEQDARRYRVEPYVIAADVYGVEPHVGRGGWTWYTGSAGWMYRIALESILGLALRNGSALALRPCIPAHWPGYGITYRLPDGTVYDIAVSRSAVAAACAEFDGAPVSVVDAGVTVPLVRDGARHILRLVLGAS